MTHRYRRNNSIGIPLNLSIPKEMGYIHPQNQNQNQNSLLVKRQTDNTTPGGGWGLTGGD